MTMNTKQIISNHITNRQLKISVAQFVKQLEAVLKQSNAKMVRSGDVLFLFTVDGDAATVYIINGAGPVAYIKGTKQFVELARKLGLKYIKMRVTDVESARKIATTSGLRNVVFDMFKEGATDPYMMTAEV